MRRLSCQLLCRSPLQPGESLLSLLARLSELNLYPNLTTVVEICRERLTEPDNVVRPTKVETYDILAELVGIDADELHAASVHRFAATITPPNYKNQSISLPSGREVHVSYKYRLHENMRSVRDLQFCPLCLKEAAYHRLCWMPFATSVYLNHQSEITA